MSDYQALGECDIAMKAARRSVELDPEDETFWLIIADLRLPHQTEVGSLRLTAPDAMAIPLPEGAVLPARMCDGPLLFHGYNQPMLWPTAGTLKRWPG